MLWPNLEKSEILLAVSGGIAAYKSAELCRLLVRCGASVRVAMTKAARHFVGETTFAALSGHPVSTGMFDSRQEFQISHIALADRAQLMIVAPATANLLAKLAHGLADDLVSTIYLAFKRNVLLAPAMNVHMWEHPAVQYNMRILRERGHAVIGPSSGEMACGHVGAGRMAEPEEILQAAGTCLAEPDLARRSLLITAGPTYEPIDPVRFIGNRSSGKMGFALAAEAASRGARVLLIAGPCALTTPLGCERIDVRTAEQMAEAVYRHAINQDAIIMAAAVADYRPLEVATDKLKKESIGEEANLALMRNEDILASLGARASPRPFLIGFAAETDHNLDALAIAKLHNKGCDLLVVNDVTAPGTGFEVDTNQVALYDRLGHKEILPLMGKRLVAHHIINRVVKELSEKQMAGTDDIGESLVGQ